MRYPEQSPPVYHPPSSSADCSEPFTVQFTQENRTMTSI